MSEVIIFSLVDRLLWGVVITVLFICGMHFLYSSRKSEFLNEKNIKLGFSSMFFSFALTRIFYYIMELQIEGRYENHVFYGDYDKITPAFEIFFKCGMISILIGAIFYFLAFEKAVKGTKYIFSTSTIILLI